MHLPFFSLSRINALAKPFSQGVQFYRLLHQRKRAVIVGPSRISAGIIYFEEFEADLRSRELRKGGARLRLPDQSFQVLAMLLERPGELITRDEIKQRLWPSDTFVDFDHGLNNAVNRLREALGDSATSPRYIETLHRRGYRLMSLVDGQGIGVLDDNADHILKPAFSVETKARGSKWKYLLFVTVVSVFVIVWVAVRFHQASPWRSTRSFILPPDGTTFNLITDLGGTVVLSPDGTKMAFVAIDRKGNARIWIRSLSNLDAYQVRDTDGATFPFWSPDGQWIGFFADGKLKKVNVAGGSPVTLCDAAFGRGGSWKDTVIIFAPESHSAIYKISDAGGQPVRITTVDTSLHTTHRWPKFLPDGKHFIFFAASHFRDATHDGVYFASIDGHEQRLVTASEADATYALGFLFFYSGSMLVSQPFNPRTGQLGGLVRPSGERVLYDSSIWKAVFDVSESGVMAYELGDSVAGTQLRWFDRHGKQLGAVGAPAFQWEPRLSPDGKKLALGVGDGGYSNIWMYDFSRDSRRQVTFGKFDHGSPVWAGQNKLFFSSKRKHYSVYSGSMDQSQGERLILETGTDSWPLDLSPDSRYLLYGSGLGIGQAKSQLWIYPIAQHRQPFRLLSGNDVETCAQFSPNGRWVAYTSNRSGRNEVYVMPFQGISSSSVDSWQVSVGGGTSPKWRRDGIELFYLAADNFLTSVSVRYEGRKVIFGAAHPLFHVDPAFPLCSYDADATGTRFLVNSAAQERTSPITLVGNWQSDFKQ